jgi:hypothetical protein
VFVIETVSVAVVSSYCALASNDPSAPIPRRSTLVDAANAADDTDSNPVKPKTPQPNLMMDNPLCV